MIFWLDQLIFKKLNFGATEDVVGLFAGRLQVDYLTIVTEAIFRNKLKWDVFLLI
jgi:hypothetical protein